MGQNRTNVIQAVELRVPAVKIRNIDAEVRNITTEVIENKVIIQGEVHKQIFFVGQDNLVHHQQDVMPFSTFVEVGGAQPGMEAQVDVVIEHIKAHLSPEGTQLRQKVILELFVKVLEIQQMHLRTNGTGPLLKMNQVIGEGTTQTLVEREVSLTPVAIKVTDVDVQIREITEHIIENKVIIQGVLVKQIFFIGTDDLGHHLEEEISFSAFVEVPGAQPGMHAQIHPRVEFVDGSLSPDGTTFFQKVVLEIFVKVTEEVQVNLAQGAGPLVKLPRVIGEDTVQVMRTSDFTLPQAAIKIVEIDAHFQQINTRVLENKVIIQGVLEKQIFFIGEDDLEYHEAETLPFSAFLDLPGAQPGMQVQINPRVEHVRGELLTPTRLHQKVVMEFFVKVVELLQINIQPDTKGPLFKVPVVIGEQIKQILVERVEVPPIPPLPAVIVPILIKEEEIEEIRRQILIEREFILPVPAIKIKEINAVVTDVTFEILDGQVLVEGEITKQIHFVDTQNRVRHTEEVVEFTTTIDIPAIEPDMELGVDVEIEDISFQLLDAGTRIAQIMVLQIILSVGDARQVQVISNIEGPGITIETIQARVLQVIGEETVEGTVEEPIQLPEVAAFPVAVEAFLANVTGVVTANQVTISGVIFKDLTLARPDETTFTVSEQIPFALTANIPGVQPTDQLQLRPEIVDIDVEIIEAGTVALETVFLEIFTKVVRSTTVNVVVNATGPIEVTRETVLLDVVDDGIPQPVPVSVVVQANIVNPRSAR